MYLRPEQLQGRLALTKPEKIQPQAGLPILQDLVVVKISESEEIDCNRRTTLGSYFLNKDKLLTFKKLLHVTIDYEQMNNDDSGNNICLFEIDHAEYLLTGRR